MGRYYVELSMTVYADSEEQAIEIAERVALATPVSEEHAGLQVEDVEGDEGDAEGYE